MKKLIVILLLMLAELPALAVDREWTGLVSGTWGTGAATNNWNPKGVPTADDDLTFGVLTTNRYAIAITALSSMNAKSMTFTAQTNGNYSFSGTFGPRAYGNVTMYDVGTPKTNKFSVLSLSGVSSTVTVERVSGAGVTMLVTASLRSYTPNTLLVLTGGGTVIARTLTANNDLVIETPVMCRDFSGKDVTVKSGGNVVTTNLYGWSDADGTYTLEAGATNTLKLAGGEGSVQAGVACSSGCSLQGTLDLVLDESETSFVDGEYMTLFYVDATETPFTDWALEAVKVHPASVGSFANCTFSKTTRRFPARSRYIDGETVVDLSLSSEGDVWVSTPNNKGYRMWLTYGVDASTGGYGVNLFCLRDNSGDMFSIMGE